MDINIIYNESCLTGLRRLPDGCVDVCVTSPPYYGLRDYKVDGQIGMEGTPEQYVNNLVAVFSEVNRVLKPDGTLWLNLGDSYAAGPKKRSVGAATRKSTLDGGLNTQINSRNQINKITPGFKSKDLIGIPWMTAFALRSAGWYLRQDIIWAKKNCMPESVKDRCTKSHEYIFMFSKQERYYYDQEAIMEPAIYDIDGTGTAARKARAAGNKLEPTAQRNGIRAGLKDARLMNGKNQDKEQRFKRGHQKPHEGFNGKWDHMSRQEQCTGMRNKRDVWLISPAQFPEAHFATFPEEIPAICIKAGSRKNGIVLDPFMGAGTTALVARKLGRSYIGFELNPDYIKLSDRRIYQELGGLFV